MHFQKELFCPQVILKLQDGYGIHGMLDEEKTNELLGHHYTGPLWKKIGQSVCTSLIGQSVYTALNRSVSVHFSK